MVLTHEIGALNTLLFVFVVSLCVVIAFFVKSKSLYVLPESAAAIIVGMITAGLARAGHSSGDELKTLTLEPEIFFFVLLPPIIFEAGYSLDKKTFFSNFWTINLYAIVGTIISAMTIGYFVFVMGRAGFVSINTSSPLQALLFGSLLSATDPVATVSVLGNAELNVHHLLYSLVFGESVLNDAVAIVLFKTFQLLGTKYGDSSTAMLGLEALGLFVGIGLGSLIVGLLFGLACSLLCKKLVLKLFPRYELSLLFLCCYGCYAFAEAIYCSGIMSLFFCGITLAHYNHSNLSETSQVTSQHMFQALAQLSEFIVYVFIGMGVFTSSLEHWHIPFFLAVTALCIFSRFLNIFPLSFVANYWRSTPVTLNMQLMLWFSGLRGAIAYSLAMQLTEEQNGPLFQRTTLLLVVTTTLICGSLTERLLSLLDLKGSDEKGSLHESEFVQPVDEAECSAEESVFNPIGECKGDEAEHLRASATSSLVAAPPVMMSRINSYFRSLDENFFMPHFSSISVKSSAASLEMPPCDTYS